MTRKALSALVWLVATASCTRSPPKATGADTTPSPPPAASLARVEEKAVEVFSGGFRDGWEDWGWCPRTTTGPEPAELHFAHWGGFIVAKPGFSSEPYGALVFRLKPPRGEADFLEVRVESSELTTFPRVKVGPQHRRDGGDGWYDVRVPMAELDPDETRFDRIVFRAFRDVDDEVTRIDGIGFTKPDASNGSARLSATAYGANLRSASLVVSCGAKATRISPLIYGIAYYPLAEGSKAQWTFGATARRWGGNTSSRYNWEKSVWNLDSDWFFENKAITSYEKFLSDDDAHAVASAVTVPMLGWVAKDDTSYSFPVSILGKQGKTDPNDGDIGNGTSPDGKKLAPPGPPTRTSQPAPPSFVKGWVEAIRARDRKLGKRSVVEYILDNEPMLWGETHRDVRVDPLGYDELVARSIEYGTAIRQADPEALIAGPAEWGWTAYFYSAKDGAAGYTLRPDRRAHGDLPLVEYYLKALHDHERKTGVKVIDLLDLHWYPQAPNVYGNGNGGTDAKTAALRLRSTRSLWDPSYSDESWIKEPVRLLPRMREWVDKYYPGLGLSIGEWNFGGEGHASGALAIAETLGRFAQFGVTSAFYWWHPPEGSPALSGFGAYRDFDGKGGHFLDYWVPSKPAEGVSLFASRDERGDHAVLIALNMSTETAVLGKIDLDACGGLASHQTYTFMRGSHGFIAGTPVGATGPSVEAVLPPSSITVLDVRLTQPMPGATAR
jgi:hypothetical protein